MAGAVPSASAELKREAKGAIDKPGITGAVTVDLSKGTLYVLHLTGNITGLQFTNVDALADEVVEVHLVQDATGSRTLTALDSHTHLVGGAVTLSGANKRDILTFRRIGAELYERSRALNI